MPFYNLVVGSDRLFPLQHVEAEVVLRVHLNLGSSVDRVVTVSRDSLGHYSGTLIELGTLFTVGDGGMAEQPTPHYAKSEVTPQHGFEAFLEAAIRLGVAGLQDRDDLVIALHQPFSVFAVEFKSRGTYHTFRFYSSYPGGALGSVEPQDRLARLVLTEFAPHIPLPRPLADADES